MIVAKESGCVRGAGFTLVETLVALTILAMVLSAVFEVFDRGLAGERLGDEHVRAAVLARAKLAEFSVPENLVEGEYTGTERGETPLRAGAPALRWRVGVQTYAGDALGRVDDAPVAPWRVRAEVAWGDGALARSLVLETIALGPR